MVGGRTGESSRGALRVLDRRQQCEQKVNPPSDVWCSSYSLKRSDMERIRAASVAGARIKPRRYLHTRQWWRCRRSRRVDLKDFSRHIGIRRCTARKCKRSGGGMLPLLARRRGYGQVAGIGHADTGCPAMPRTVVTGKQRAAAAVRRIPLKHAHQQFSDAGGVTTVAQRHAGLGRFVSSGYCCPVPRVPGHDRPVGSRRDSSVGVTLPATMPVTRRALRQRVTMPRRPLHFRAGASADPNVPGENLSDRRRRLAATPHCRWWR